MFKQMLLLSLLSMIAIEYASAKCIPCQVPDTSWLTRASAVGLRERVAREHCSAINPGLIQNCTAKKDPLRNGSYYVDGSCVNNCLQCECVYHPN